MENNLRCSFSNCKISPTYICSCSHIKSFLCERHSKIHSSLKIKHRVSYLENISSLNGPFGKFNSPEDIVNYLDDLIELVISTSNEMHQIIEKSCSSFLSNIYQEHKKYIQLITQNFKYGMKDEDSKIVHFAQLSEQKNLILQSTEQVKDMLKSLFRVDLYKIKEPKKEPRPVTQEFRAIQNNHNDGRMSMIIQRDCDERLVNGHQGFGYNNERISLSAERDVVPSEKKMFFVANKESGMLAFFDMDNEEATFPSIFGSQKFYYGAHIVKLPDQSYFYYGGLKDGFISNLTYVLNISNGTVKQYNANKPRWNGACVLKGDSVYAFGGWTNSKTASCEADKFNYRNGIWQSISRLPYNVFRNTASVLNEHIIIISGSIEQILNFDSNTEEYKVLSSLDGRNEFKLIFENWIFIREKPTALVVYSDNRIKAISLRNSWPKMELQTGCMARRGDKVYFVEHTSNIRPRILKFGIKTLTFDVINALG
ncbi:hypothetical protein SteCoe_1767 [Stentor coeruleus]|uniref:Uncharacterized protein n=1 Tax=Stentor coeruleus TaxID=5963 RepID=A0A1R2D116_9CILI|nr:hypothetical protein SteCoe_1767 [Stentor coeruleus]